MEDGKPIKGSLYIYAPNKVAPVFFAVAFAVSGSYHIWQCYRFKCFKLTGLQPVCALLFTIGFALREYGAFDYMYNSKNLLSLMMFIMSQVLIYVSPPLLELANYQVLGPIFYYIPYFSPLDPGRVLSTFGALSALVEGLNGLGVSFRSNVHAPQHRQDLGRTITIAALVLQIVVIVCFVLLASIFHRRCNKSTLHAKAVSAPLITLYMSTSLILIRCIYRTVEQCGVTKAEHGDLNTLSPILRYEWFFYVFEATLMLVNSILWNVRHPAHSLPVNHNVYLARDGKTEVEREVRKAASRGLAILSVLTHGAFGREKRENRQFWELDTRSGDNPLSQESTQVFQK